jgi:hypothetical protein
MTGLRTDRRCKGASGGRLYGQPSLDAQGSEANRGDRAAEGHAQAHLTGRLGVEGTACTSLTASSKPWLPNP